MRIFVFATLLLAAFTYAEEPVAEVAPLPSVAEEPVVEIAPLPSIAELLAPYQADIETARKGVQIPASKLRVVAVGDERLCGNSSLHRTNLALLRDMLEKDGVTIEYAGLSVDPNDGIRHECHPRYSVSQFRSGGGKANCSSHGCRLIDWMPHWGTYDVILALMGTYDCVDMRDPNEFFLNGFNHVERVVMALRGGHHDGHTQQPILPKGDRAKKVFLSHLPPVLDDDLRLTLASFNEAISFNIGEMPEGGDLGEIPVTIVKTDSIDPATDLIEGTYQPNQSGQVKMALAWYSAIMDWLREKYSQ